MKTLTQSLQVISMGPTSGVWTVGHESETHTSDTINDVKGQDQKGTGHFASLQSEGEISANGLNSKQSSSTTRTLALAHQNL